jgi:CheY-like chemotaxis protein
MMRSHILKAGEQVDLVFSDIQTPGLIDGLQLAETLRGKYPDILVILTSGNAEPKHVGILWTFVPSHATSRKQSHSCQRC